ncbi:hypothetical protein IGI04_030441 [Brassica rapa subsp. trilocularis]|uniref:Uncharacterized protein n=1 Tax=Brassica rapa subsp. trilocularis TaxID=1813537 RepID=A0ABQ7LTF8_BRACM|nr:hypothetical protein IGI04_030441 [Brassica rapa subsp. trilocularis]
MAKMLLGLHGDITIKVKKINSMVLRASSEWKLIPDVTEIYLKWSFAWWLWCLESDVAKQITGDEL